MPGAESSAPSRHFDVIRRVAVSRYNGLWVDVPPADEDSPYWEDRALCRSAPDHFTTRIPSWTRSAMHACRVHCPVLKECRTFGANLDPSRRVEVVLGGVAYAHNGLMAIFQRANPTCVVCKLQAKAAADEPGA